MNKLVTVAAIGFFALAAQAQSNPPGAPVPPNSPGYATGKPERAAEAKKNMRPKGMVKPQVGDTAKSPEGGAIGTDRAAVSGEARAISRDDRRPGKPKSTQGGTPN